MSSAKRAVDEDANTPSAKIVRADDDAGEKDAMHMDDDAGAKDVVPAAKIERVCCGECGRKYAGPLDLPPVVIMSITKTMPDKVERERNHCYVPDGASPPTRFLDLLSPISQAALREALSAPLAAEKRVTITTASGDVGTCVIDPDNWSLNGQSRHLVELHLDILPRISPAINAANVSNPFVVAPAPISVRDVWGVSLDNLPLVEKQFLWLHNLSDAVHGCYLGICRLRFVTLTSGHFELALIGDGPNMGSAGGPTVEYLAPLYRIEFMFPPARNAAAN